MNHLVTIPKSDISKADIADIAAGLILRIEEGEVNPIAAHVRLKAVVKALSISLTRLNSLIFYCLTNLFTSKKVIYSNLL